mmetsp:Transcript_11935/g.26152  ORF Transcript_11935/g.26152 Transcript_11935/m.26152 type:complete len:307 (-) Transcript_11935:554-1474(-)
MLHHLVLQEIPNLHRRGAIVHLGRRGLFLAPVLEMSFETGVVHPLRLVDPKVSLHDGRTHRGPGGVQLWILFKDGVVEALHRRDRPGLDGPGQHLLVPVREPFLVGRLLIVWMGPEDEVVAFERGTAPDVGLDEAVGTGVGEVGDQDLLVDGGAAGFGPEVVHRVQVGDVDAFVSGDVGGVVLVDVHAEEADVDVVDGLEHEDGLGGVAYFFGDGVGTTGDRIVLVQLVMAAYHFRDLIGAGRFGDHADGDGFFGASSETQLSHAQANLSLYKSGQGACGKVIRGVKRYTGGDGIRGRLATFIGVS